MLRKVFFLSFLAFLSLAPKAQSKAAFEPAVTDTTIKPAVAKEEDLIIEEIIGSKAAPMEEKVQYLSQTTRYGLKGLFNKYAYNQTSGLTYSAQINQNAAGFMENYIQKHGKFLMNMKGWGQPYFTLIENVFAQYGLPQELKYLAVIESHLNPSATSWVGAGGPWQFMPYTAREYGLVVQRGYDERRDYVKSTDAAARYLLRLYKQMNHDWLLVIAAYNCGPGGVYKAMRNSGSNNFWDMQYYLPEESRNHVKKFIATHYIMEGGNGGGFFAGVNATTGEGIEGYSQSVAYRPSAISNKYTTAKPNLTTSDSSNIATTSVSGKYNSKVIAKYLDFAATDFARLNPYFDKLLMDGNSYDLRLPAEKMNIFLARKYDILNECVQNIYNSSVDYSTETTKYRKKVKFRGK